MNPHPLIAPQPEEKGRAEHSSWGLFRGHARRSRIAAISPRALPRASPSARPLAKPSLRASLTASSMRSPRTLRMDGRVSADVGAEGGLVVAGPMSFSARGRKRRMSSGAKPATIICWTSCTRLATRSKARGCWSATTQACRTSRWRSAPRGPGRIRAAPGPGPTAPGRSRPRWSGPRAGTPPRSAGTRPPDGRLY